ncbi:MAG: hypothetical protein PHG48_02765 [Eubacteriales bacterium]|nr:hypothetical protein [Eubacteriales bacterium]
MTVEFSEKERAEILREYFARQAEYREALRSFDLEDSEVPPGAYETLGKEILRLIAEYRQKVPLRQLSRCPFTGEVLKHSIDSHGIDGLWWDNNNPVRPDEELPKSFLGFTGALSLGNTVNGENKIEFFPFTCSPGPDVPFVLPRLLYFDQVKAVISSCRIGMHRAYLVFYFSWPPLTGVERPNEFGMSSYRYRDLNGDLRLGEYYEFDRDFELEEWVTRGKLLWINPDDTANDLKSDVSRCPYIGLKGSRENKYVSEGRFWRSGENNEDGNDPSAQRNAARIEISRESVNKAIKYMEEGGL